MTDRSADIHAWNITNENQTISQSVPVKSGVTSYKGAIIEDNSGYADMFATADGKEIMGIQTSMETLGDGTKTITVKSKFTLKNVYLTSVAATDLRKPVWASGASIKVVSTDTYNDLSLTYSEGAKLVGFVRAYRSSGRADIYIDPKVLETIMINLGHIAYGELAASGSPLVNNFGQDLILSELQSTPRLIVASANKEANCILKNGSDSVTGTLKVIDSGYTLGTTVVKALSGSYTYLEAGTNLTLYVASVGTSGDPDQGECDIAVECYTIPKCTDF